ncbi:hypothetical protein STEG23_002998, partial [Scotinomys teguina]
MQDCSSKGGEMVRGLFDFLFCHKKFQWFYQLPGLEKATDDELTVAEVLEISCILFFPVVIKGLTLDLGTPVLAGECLLSCPSLDIFGGDHRAVPRNVVATGNQVTLLCEGPLNAKEYVLYKEGSAHHPITTTLLETENTATFSISSVEWNNAGNYWCNYTSIDGISEKSDFLELVVTGVIPNKVTLSALPGPVVTSGGNVTLKCVSEQEYSMFILMKEDEKFSRPLPSQNIDPELFGALFTVGPVTHNQRWRFTCYGYYLSSPQAWSVSSNHLELLVSGSAENITASQSMSNPKTGKWMELENVILSEGTSKPTLRTMTSDMVTIGKQGLYHFLKVIFSDGFCFFCVGIFSDPDLCPDDLNLASTGMYSKSCPDAFLHILLPGSSRKPSLLTLQGPLLAPGEKLTFQCCSDMSYDRFALSKEGGSDLTQMSAHPTQAGESHANFTLHSVNLNTGGRYRCYGSSNFSSEWSAPSDHLDVVITGHPPVTPNLSVHPGTTVSSGEKVTLLCKSSIRVDSFLLFKEGEFRPYMHQVSKLQDSQYQAEFSMRAVTPSLRGSYMCFGSQRSSPYLLSKPSVPVEIIVSGLARYQKILIGVSVGFLLLLFFLAFFSLLRLRHQKNCSKGVQAATNMQHSAGAEESVTRDRGIQK